MRFSSSAAVDVEDRLGERASALEARVVARGSLPRTDRPVRLAFEPAALGPEDRSLLQDAGRLGFEGIRATLELEPGALDGRASSPALRCLTAALRAALAEPGPARLLGIVNVTPDSFSDGGAFAEPAAAIEHALSLVDQGADLVDVGGESTRPGSEPVPAEVELERVLPVIAAVARDGRAAVSVDTRKASVAGMALDAGATVVNDVSAGRDDPELLPLVARRGAGLILVHMRGTPRDMQASPRYADVVHEVAVHLRERARAAWRAGVDPARIVLDPGIGFGKLLAHNLELIAALPELRSLGFPVCLGVSRKSFLGALATPGGREPARRSEEPFPAHRTDATTAAVALGAFLGAEIHRVHEVTPARSALRVAGALRAQCPRGSGSPH